MGWDGMVILVQESSKSTLGDMNIRESAKFSQKTSGSEHMLHQLSLMSKGQRCCSAISDY